MKLVLVKHNETPPDYFRFTHPETGHVTQEAFIKDWLKAIAKYREDNQFPPISAEDCIDQFCKLLPDGWCRYENGVKPEWFVNTRLGVWDVLRGTKAMGDFIVAGMPLVDKDLAASRAQTCSRCYFNVPTQGCAPCVGLASAILSISGANKTPSDASLKSCACCSCSVAAKVWIPAEIINKSTTAEQMHRFPDFCWQKKEIESLSEDGKTSNSSD